MRYRPKLKVECDERGVRCVFEFSETAVCGDVVIFVFSEREGASVKVGAVVAGMIALYAGDMDAH